MTTETIRAALYARISEDITGEGAGVERQVADAEALAASRGWTVAGTYSDNDISALRGKFRPGYDALMASARRGEVDRIIVWQSSRLWRNRTERARDIEILADLRVGIIACRGADLDLSTAYGRAMAGLLGEFDTMESEVKSERVAAAAAQRARHGRPNGEIGYGWTKVAPGEYVIDEKEAAIVREVTDRLLAGETMHSVTDDLNDRKIPPPGTGRKIKRRGITNPDGTKWGRTSVKKLAIRPANAALRVHHRGRPDEALLPGAWPALIERERWESVTTKLAANSTKGKVQRPGGRRHLISYSAVGACGVCGGPLRSHALKPRQKTHRPQTIYSCIENNCVGRNQAKVDALVSEVVIARLAEPDAREWLTGDNDTARAAADRAVALTAQLDGAASSYAEGKISLSMLETITAKLTPQIEAAERERTAHLATLDPKLLDTLAGPQARESWKALTIPQQHGLLEATGIRVKIMPTRRGPVFRPEDVKIDWIGADSE